MAPVTRCCTKQKLERRCRISWVQALLLVTCNGSAVKNQACAWYQASPKAPHEHCHAADNLGRGITTLSLDLSCPQSPSLSLSLSLSPLPVASFLKNLKLFSNQPLVESKLQHQDSIKALRRSCSAAAYHHVVECCRDLKSHAPHIAKVPDTSKSTAT